MKQMSLVTQGIIRMLRDDQKNCINIDRDGDELKLSCLDASELAAHLNRGALLLTASPQLAADWKRRLVSACQDQVCETPAVIGWQEWLTSLGGQIPDLPVAFNRLQEMQLWEQAIRRYLAAGQSDDLSPASIRGLAGHACSAYALMREYCIEERELKPGSEESEALASWIALMHRQLQGHRRRMLAADLGGMLLTHLGAATLPDEILLDGFDALTPLQWKLIDALQQAGCSFAQIKTAESAAIASLTACENGQAECSHIAAAVKALLDEQPQARIAVLISESIADAGALRRSLNKALMPESQLAPAGGMQAVALAGGRLIDAPMLWQLLHVLGLAGEFSVTFDAFSVLLFSPWLKGYECERLDRARLDALFRRQNRHRMTFRSLIHSSQLHGLPQLLLVIRALAAWNRRSRSANDWVKATHELLKATGFVQTGSDDEVKRSNHEIRQMNAFREVLVSLAAVDAVSGAISWAQFLSLLRAGCSQARLPLTPKYANVVMMPLSQSGGLRFDHVFLAGMDEEAFPPAARVHPLLPFGLQKKHAIAMSSGALAYAAAQKLWDDVLKSAPHIEISYAVQRDERELSPSSFVAALERLDCHVADRQQSLPLEDFDDAPAVPLRRIAGEAVYVPGGASVIRNQSACPFRAFATHRLGISSLEETTPGIDAGRKGSLIHLALEQIWTRLQCRQQLAAMSDEETMQLIDAAVSRAWQESHLTADAESRACEKKRMRRVLTEWLQLELERPDFRVTGIEQEYRLQLPESSATEFTVRVKADRMDEDACGRRILIDYKTGAKQSSAKWLVKGEGGRIEEPQLPLYAMAAALGCEDAVAFARVRSGDMGYEGLSGIDIGVHGIAACDGKRGAPEDWQQVLDEWRENINALAAEFVNGRCDVSPRDENVCDCCRLEAVCRIEESGFGDEA